MSSEAVVIPIAAVIGMVFFMYFGERIFKSVVVEVLAGLGMKSASEAPDPIINAVAGHGAQRKAVPPKKRNWLWRLRHNQRP